MAVDLHLHVRTPAITDDDLSKLFCTTIGSRWFNPDRWTWEEREPAIEATMKAPNVWIGEVSWLKTALTGDDARDISHPVQRVSDLVGEDLPVLTDALIEAICEALRVPNRTIVHVATVSAVRPFLLAHEGEPVFTLSW